MADIAKKITKLDEKIDKLKERIKSDTAECEKLSEQKALLIYQSLCRQYSCEGQALADMIEENTSRRLCLFLTISPCRITAMMMLLTRKKCSDRLLSLRRMILTRIKYISDNKTFRAGVTPLQHLAIACREKNIAGGKEQFERDNYCRRQREGRYYDLR